METPCEYLEWDSRFFGKRIARVRGDRLEEASVESVLRWCREHRIEGLYFLAVPDDRRTLELAEANGFHLTDIRVSLEKHLRGPEVGPAPDLSGRIRPVSDPDRPALLALAQEAFRLGRFHYDSRISKESADALYRAWLERCLEEAPQGVWVAEVGGKPAGFVASRREEGDWGRIELLALELRHRGRGLGGALLTTACRELQRENRAAKVRTVTQARNVAALRAFHKNAFIVEGVRLWYHRWFP